MQLKRNDVLSGWLAASSLCLGMAMVLVAQLVTKKPPNQ